MADELQRHCFPKTDDTDKVLILCPATYDWLQRLDKYVPQTEVK